MKKALMFTAAASAALLFAGCATVGTSSDDAVVSTKPRSGGFMGLSQEDEVKTSHEIAFKDARKIVIGGFKIGFNASKELVDSRGGGMFSGPQRTATGQVRLEGVSEADRQQITDRAYDQFLALLEEHGYEVIDRYQLTKSPLYADIGEVNFPKEEDSSGWFSSYGVSYYHSPTKIGNQQPMFPNEVKPGSFSSFNSAMYTLQREFYKESGARIINVTYALDFAGAEDQRGFVKHALELGQIMSVDNGKLRITGTGETRRADDTGSIELGQPVSSDLTFATITDETNEGAAAANVATRMAFGFLRGGLSGAAGSSQTQTRQYVFEATPEQYEAAALDALGKANTKLVESMVSLRDK